MFNKATTTTKRYDIKPPGQHQQYIAVQIPEVVSHILSYLAPCDNPYPLQFNITSTARLNTKHLYQCLLINRLWYECAVRLLWRHVAFEATNTNISAFHQFVRTFAHKPINSPLPPILPASYSSSIPLFSPTEVPSSCGAKKGLPAPSCSTPLTTHSQPLVLPSNLPSSNDLHHRSLRSFTLRKIKQRHTAANITAIAKKASYLQRLELYIVTSLTNEALTPFFMHTPSCLTHVSLPGCHRVSDASILVLARHVPDLVHLDLRACHLITDVSLTAIATSCPRLQHLNVGRVREKHRVTDQSMVLIAEHTQVAVVGMAGCDIGDQTILALATHRRQALQRVSANDCPRLTSQAIQALLLCCPKITVFEMKECPHINDWRTIEALVDRKVSFSLNHQQNFEFERWSRRYGKNRINFAPVKRPR